MSARTAGYIVESGRTPRGRWTSVWRFRGLLGSFTLRELQVRYRQAALGFAWALAQPLALTAVTTLVFHAFLRVEADGAPYPLFAYTGLMVWSFFHTAVSGAVPTLVNNAGLIRKIWFPREVLPLAVVGAAGLDLACGLGLWLALLAAYGRPLGWTLLWVPPLLLVLVAFTAACALAGAAVNARWRDVKHGLPLLLQVLFFAAPLVYPFERVPPAWRPVAALDPLVAVVEGLRAAALHARAPEAWLTATGAGAAALWLALAWFVFLRAERRFADVV
jgi:ABC-type polysaccharide/polyol phosphate export permease